VHTQTVQEVERELKIGGSSLQGTGSGSSTNWFICFLFSVALHWAVISSNHNGISVLTKASADATITNEKVSVS
jgi:hypothetical protein